MSMDRAAESVREEAFPPVSNRVTTVPEHAPPIAVNRTSGALLRTSHKCTGRLQRVAGCLTCVLACTNPKANGVQLDCVRRSEHGRNVPEFLGF